MGVLLLLTPSSQKEMKAEAEGYIIFTATQKDGLIVDDEVPYHETNINMARLAISQCLSDAPLNAHVEEYKGSPVPPARVSY